MIIVDTALRKRQRENRPIKVGLIGPGFMGRGIALQILQYTPGMRLVAICGRHLDQAERAYAEAGAARVQRVSTGAQLDSAIAAGTYAVLQDPELLCRSAAIDVIVEVTGAIELGAQVALEAIRNRKHLVFMNAEVDGTVGPILQRYAREAGVIVTNCDGDQPGVTMNLYRFVSGLGVRPVLCGNIKGLQDPHRNPTTQKGFAERWGQKPQMVSSFADGTKISFEQAIIANATGMRVGRRGMFGPTVTGQHVTEAASWFPHEAMLEGPGIVDYCVGAVPGPGVFVLGVHDDPRQQHYLNLYKLGEGPFYCFYTPYHLCHFEVPNTVVRVVDFGDPAIVPLDGPRVEVVTTAKVDLEPGQELDGIGGYLTYGQCENAAETRDGRLLPMGVAEGCTVLRRIPRDQVLTYDDVELPPGRLVDRLRAEQGRAFGANSEFGIQNSEMSQ